jgi:hypothetical protein
MMKVKNHELIFHCIIGYRHNGFQRKNNELYSAKNLEMFQMYDTFPWEKIIYDVNDINVYPPDDEREKSRSDFSLHHWR